MVGDLFGKPTDVAIANDRFDAMKPMDPQELEVAKIHLSKRIYTELLAMQIRLDVCSRIKHKLSHG